MGLGVSFVSSQALTRRPELRTVPLLYGRLVSDRLMLRSDGSDAFHSPTSWLLRTKTAARVLAIAPEAEMDRFAHPRRQKFARNL